MFIQVEQNITLIAAASVTISLRRYMLKLIYKLKVWACFGRAYRDSDLLLSEGLYNIVALYK